MGKKGKIIVLECSFCSSEILLNGSTYRKSLKENKSGNFFCSKACHNKFRIKKSKLEYLDSAKKCINCDGLIPFDKYWKTKKFCSQSCFGYFNSRDLKKVSKSCYFCGCDVLAYSNQDSFKIRCDKCRKEKKLENHKRRVAVLRRKALEKRIADGKPIKLKIPKVDKEKEKNLCKICGSAFCKSNYGICKSSKESFLAFIKYFNFDSLALGTRRVFAELNKMKAALYKDYHTDKMSLPEMAKKYKCKNHNQILNIFSRIGIVRRSLSESISISFLNENRLLPSAFSKYKTGWHVTWEGSKVFYRSGYELKYCQELDEKKIRYFLEKLRIKYFNTDKNRQAIAIPDFYLPDSNEIIEIKSCYTYNEQEMRDKFKAYRNLGYKCKLIVDFEEVII